MEGWLVLAVFGVLLAWAIWMCAKAINSPSEPFGQGGYGSGSEADKIRRYRPTG